MAGYSNLLSFVLGVLAMSVGAAGKVKDMRCIMYLTGQHPVIPTDAALTTPITHVALAFLNSALFNTDPAQRHGSDRWPLFMSVSEVRGKFAPGTKIMVAIGGWGDTRGFEVAAETEETRKIWARNVGVMVRDVGADGVDVDWEYPGGNGEDYKKESNEEKKWQIDAYPLLLQALRKELGPKLLISAAVPGLERDMLAFTSDTVPTIVSALDFVNVMTYDLLNRRDNITKHHTGIELSRQGVEAYISRGAPPDVLNLGFAFYTKWVLTGPCEENPIGCPTLLLEDPVTGADMGRTGGFSYHDAVPSDVKVSYGRALKEGRYDEVGGGYYYWDEEERRWWTFDTVDTISRKGGLMRGLGVGGVFAWGLGEDAGGFEHLRALEGLLEDEGKARGGERMKTREVRMRGDEL